MLLFFFFFFCLFLRRILQLCSCFMTMVCFLEVYRRPGSITMSPKTKLKDVSGQHLVRQGPRSSILGWQGNGRSIWGLQRNTSIGVLTIDEYNSWRVLCGNRPNDRVLPFWDDNTGPPLGQLYPYSITILILKGLLAIKVWVYTWMEILFGTVSFNRYLKQSLHICGLSKIRSFLSLEHRLLYYKAYINE